MDNSNNDREQLKVFLEDAHLQQYYEALRDILKVTKVSELQYVFTKDLAQIGMSKPERRRLKKIYATYYPNACIYRLKKLLCSKKTKHCRSHGRRSIPMEVLPARENVMNGSIKHIIPIEDITINKELGTGQFGVVQLGTWTTGNQRLQVAIKCLGQERMTSDSNEFLKEAAVMHSIEHRNIVRLYGVVLHMDSLMLVTELAPLRSLLECLREVSLRTSFPVPTLCDFAEQICDGMAYLERKRLIHRDLAARNILVFNKYEVKISDFGLSRALGAGKDYYQTNYNVNLKLPVAWCAPECILYLRFTSSSDVWAFGVCLWEMFTYGFQPWAAFSGQQILEAIDSPNYQRLERPECCPEDYYTMMLECWSHEPNKRPKFKDLVSRLRDIKPETVQAIATFVRPEGGRRPGMLEYKSGQIITVLGRQRETRGHDMGHMYENKNTCDDMQHTYENKNTNMAHCTLWYGVLPGGTCGMFDPAETKPYIEVEKGSHFASISPHPMRQSSRTIRSSLLRSDVKRHTYTGKRTIQRSMISSPQGDVKHTGHVGLDGAYFGDIPFLETAGPPLQIVSPYKPSEDVEQQPLINPNSPSHLSGASGSHYSLHGAGRDSKNRDEVDLSYGNTKSKNQKKVSHKSTSEPTASKKFFNRVKNATLGRSHRSEDNAASKTDEVHEYHEISDTDTEGNATDLSRLDSCGTPESPGLPKGYGDFSQSLIDEMESMFRNLDSSRRDEASGTGRSAGGETLRSHTLSKADKKKQAFHTGTLKPMSAGEEKTLATAVALANELTSKSMNDLDGERKPPNSPSDRSKFQLKFPQFSLYNATHEPEKDAAGKHERRNFSEEANSVPDIQSIITEESKHAYTSLIEQPMTSSTVITHLGPHSILTMPKPAPRSTSRSQFKSLQLPRTSRPAAREPDQQVPSCAINELPLPPRNTKPKLVDKPRHVRKYPLKLPNAPAPDRLSHTIIYQNASLPPAWPVTPKVRAVSPVQPSTSVYANEVDVCDGKEKKMDTNPFKSGSCSGNPFDCSDDDDDIDCGLDLYYADGSDDDEEPDEGLVKDCSDHVSVEDLLEFANQKPCGRQRGVESDEVRIMRKVLKKYKVSAEQCVNALELTDWDAHKAIKVVRVQIATETNVSLQHCIAELEQTSGDIQKAAAALQLKMDL